MLPNYGYVILRNKRSRRRNNTAEVPVFRYREFGLVLCRVTLGCCCVIRVLCIVVASEVPVVVEKYLPQ